MTGSIIEAVLVGCLAPSLLIGCQGVDVASHREFESSSRQHTSPGTEIAVINQQHSNHVVHKPLSFPEGLKKDVTEFWPMVAQDAKQIATARNAALLGVALGGSLVIREELDEDVRKDTAQHSQRWGDASEFLGYLGNAEAQVPILLAIHASSLVKDDEGLHDVSKTVLSAYSINGLSTIMIKGIVNTDRPSDTWNNGDYGFPSFHISSTTTIAAVLDEYYGPQMSLPAYALAGLIGWSRIDQRDHDLSDVIFGAAMGYVIGKSVARHHLEGGSQISILPAVDPSSGSVELLVEVPY